MYGSRRFWTTAGVGALLVGVAVVLARPEPLVGAAAIAAWLLATQFLASREFQRATSLDVSYTTAVRRVGVDQPVTCRLVAERDGPARSTVEVTAPAPLAARGAAREDRTVTLQPGLDRAATTFDLTFPVAGRFEFGQPTLQVTDALGLFTERLPRGDGPTVDATTEGPRDIHVGRGGDRVVAAYGEHATDQRGPGLLPEELRPYESSDPADSIDWKATARLNEPHVREHQAETDRETVIVLDHRVRMAAGRGRETMLAYAREVALGIAASAVQASDPLGLYGVGDEGLTVRHTPTTSPRAYAQLQTKLRELDVTDPTEQTAGTSTADPSAATDPARARRLSQTLQGDDTAFGRSLRPFLDSSGAYVERLAGDPLFGAISEFAAGADGNQWTVVVTSDHDPTRLKEAIKHAAGRSAAVLVFVTPTVLFERGDDLEAAYERYVAFEELRRDLDRIPRVSAFEVGPGDRLQKLLAARRARTTGT